MTTSKILIDCDLEVAARPISQARSITVGFGSPRQPGAIQHGSGLADHRLNRTQYAAPWSFATVTGDELVRRVANCRARASAWLACIIPGAPTSGTAGFP